MDEYFRDNMRTLLMPYHVDVIRAVYLLDTGETDATFEAIQNFLERDRKRPAVIQHYDEAHIGLLFGAANLLYWTKQVKLANRFHRAAADWQSRIETPTADHTDDALQRLELYKCIGRYGQADQNTPPHYFPTITGIRVLRKMHKDFFIPEKRDFIY